VDTVMILWVPNGVNKFLTRLAHVWLLQKDSGEWSF
jgi:hypothetical protein